MKRRGFRPGIAALWRGRSHPAIYITPRRGKVGEIAKGVRRARSRFGGVWSRSSA